jgi:hypothetical protein
MAEERWKARRVFLSSMATVIGPTPSGKGVMADAIGSSGDLASSGEHREPAATLC